MGPGGRGEVCKLTPSWETRLGGDAAAETFSSRLVAGMARRGGVARRGSPAHAGEGRPWSFADVHASGSRRASWSVAGALGWVPGRGLESLVACDRAFPGRGPGGGERVPSGCARGCVRVCAHAARAGRVPLPLTKPQWSSGGGHRAPPHASSPGLRRRLIPGPSTTTVLRSRLPATCRQPGTRGSGCGLGRVAPGKVLSFALALGLGASPNLRLRRG